MVPNRVSSQYCIAPPPTWRPQNFWLNLGSLELQTGSGLYDVPAFQGSLAEPRLFPGFFEELLRSEILEVEMMCN